MREHEARELASRVEFDLENIVRTSPELVHHEADIEFGADARQDSDGSWYVEFTDPFNDTNAVLRSEQDWYLYATH